LSDCSDLPHIREIGLPRYSGLCGKPYDKGDVVKTTICYLPLFFGEKIAIVVVFPVFRGNSSFVIRVLFSSATPM